MGIREKENQRRSVIAAMMDSEKEAVQGTASRGKGNKKMDKKQKGFRLSKVVACALEIKSVKTGQKQEEMVEEWLRIHLADEIEQLEISE